MTRHDSIISPLIDVRSAPGAVDRFARMHAETSMRIRRRLLAATGGLLAVACVMANSATVGAGCGDYVLVYGVDSHGVAGRGNEPLPTHLAVLPHYLGDAPSPVLPCHGPECSKGRGNPSAPADAIPVGSDESFVLADSSLSQHEFESSYSPWESPSPCKGVPNRLRRPPRLQSAGI